jgi:arylamine N-acetyltransferase
MYLSRLGLPGNLAPTAETLAHLQRRHQDAVPYENLAIMLGRPDSTDPGQTLKRIAAGGNAGYCFHLALLVTIDGRRWWPDLGLGDAFRDPVEVVAGEIRQGPFKYQITDAGAEAWSFRHDPAAGSIAGLDVRASRPADAEVAAAHRVLSTPPDGRFTRTLVVLRRDDAGTEGLRGIRYQRIGDGAFTRDLASYDDWRTVMESLGVGLADVAGDELRSLHARMLADHENPVVASER